MKRFFSNKYTIDRKAREGSRYSLGRALIEAIFGLVSVSESHFFGILCCAQKTLFAYTNDTLCVSKEP